MQIGDRIRVRAYKADGSCYRRWRATVEEVGMGRVVTVTPFGHRLEGEEGIWICQHAVRTYYWADRWYNLLEVYGRDGELEEIYINVSSPVEILDAEIRFTDYELDVSKRPPHEPRICDQDEFREAAARYGYSDAFQKACHRVAREAVGIANRWVAQGLPAIETQRGTTA
jgi:protein associated with RNAse G/E